MRDRGAGSITGPEGRKRARLPGCFGRKSVGVYATAEEAQAVLDAAVAELAADPLPVGLTLNEWAADVIDARGKGDHKRRTVGRDRGRWASWVKGSLLGKTPLLDVTEADVRRWLESLRKRDGSRMAPTSARNALSLVRVVLEAAREAGRIEENPANRVKLSAPARRKIAAREIVWLRQEEIDRVLGCDEIPIRARCVFAVAIYTGLRAGELWGLRWENVDLKGRVLHVRHSFEDTPKTHQIRDVPLLRPAREALSTWKAIYDGAGIRSRHDLVWPARDEAWHADGYDAGWPTHRLAAGITRKVRFHDLRHTCASHLLQGTWAPELIERRLRLEEVRDVLGHKTVATTQIYAHLDPDRLRSLVVDRDAIGTEERAAARDRTADLRFTKPEGIRLVPGVSTTDPAGGPVTSPDLRTLAARYLRALANGDPMRDRHGAELGALALELTQPVEEGATSDTRRAGG